MIINIAYKSVTIKVIISRSRKVIATSVITINMMNMGSVPATTHINWLMSENSRKA
jgi:hypothetical protein